MLRDQPVTVLGAGIAGLAVARALCLRGARVRVLERAPAIGEVGAGIQISPNGGAVLDALGLGPRIEAASLASGAVVLREHAAGRQVLRLDLAGRGRFSLIHRADLIAVLEEGAREAGATIETGVEVAEVDLEAGRAALVRADGRVERPEGLILGADGLHSRVRAAVLGAASPTFTGQVAWRATVPVEPGSVPVEAQVFMGPGRHLVAYPLRDGGMLNVVAVEERSAWAEEGWHHEGDPDRLRAAFAGFGGPVPGWLARVGTVRLWGLFRHPVARRWSRGDAVLIGDAAHPTLPFLAQGACMALEDVWVLTAMLERYGARRGAFAAYQMARQDRVRRIVAAATANARNYHLRNPLVRAVAHGGLRLMGAARPAAALAQFDWLYAYDPTRAFPLPRAA